MEVPCHFDLKMFPHDKQSCEIEIESSKNLKMILMIILNIMHLVGHTVDDIDFFWEPGYPTLMYLKDNYIKHFRLTKWSNQKDVNFYATGSKEYCFKMDSFQAYNSFHSCLLEAHLETEFPEAN